MFYTMNSFEKIRLFLNRFKVPTVLYISKFLIFPYRVNLCIAVANRNIKINFLNKFNINYYSYIIALILP